MARRRSRGYEPQVLQLPAAQPAQEPPVPATGVDSPDALFEKTAQQDIILSALPWQSGQVSASSARLNGRICSNLLPQSLQIYSYIGIRLLPSSSLLTRSSRISDQHYRMHRISISSLRNLRSTRESRSNNSIIFACLSHSRQ